MFVGDTVKPAYPLCSDSFLDLTSGLFSFIHSSVPLPGFLYYEDISKPVSIAEAKAVGCIIEEAASCFDSGVTITLTGGFCR